MIVYNIKSLWVRRVAAVLLGPVLVLWFTLVSMVLVGRHALVNNSRHIVQCWKARA